jgi:hypothetical protein
MMQRFCTLIALLTVQGSEVFGQNARTDSSGVQQSAQLRAQGVLASAGLAVPYIDGVVGDLTLVMGRLNWVRDWRPGVELALGAVLRTPAAVAQVGLVMPVPLTPEITFLPVAGVNGVAAITAGGGAHGFYGGASLMMHGKGPVGLRLGVTRYTFGDLDETGILLLELGIVRDSRRR